MQTVKTKIAFRLFLVLLIVLLPFSYLLSANDFASSLVPGWKTTIAPYNLLNVGFKFLIMLLVVIFYWKLSRLKSHISTKVFIAHLILTIPAIVIAKFPLVRFIDFQTENIEKLTEDFRTMSLITGFINIIFLVAQLLFFVYCFITKSKAKPADVKTIKN